MKKIIFILLISSFILAGCGNENNQNTQEMNITRTSNFSKPVETEVGTYSTPIYDKTESRVHNIRLACDSLNGTVVENGQTFSFCETLGDATPEGGYEPASTFDEHGNVIQDYGGGKCQISSTLYCVIKDLPEIEVTERHAHSKKVYYVPEGFDAAVSYGSVDLKFKNETGSKVKIYSSTDGETVTVKLVKIS